MRTHKIKMRYVTLDTETTGLTRQKNPSTNHRIIEIACCEIIDNQITKNIFHKRIKTTTNISKQASKIHGLFDTDLKNSPHFSKIAPALFKFIDNAPLIIHNAPFDIAFLNKEFTLLPTTLQPNISFRYIDTLKIARELFPQESNTLDALMNRYNITDPRSTHSALTDAKILAKIFLRLKEVKRGTEVR